MKILVEGIAAEYGDEGAGPVVLLLHGWKDTLHTFDALMPILAKHFRVVRVDLPGFGGSEAPSVSWCLEDYARFVERFVSKLQLTVHLLVGHSFGGRIVIKGVSTRVLIPRKVVLIASAGIAKANPLRIVAVAALAKLGKVILCVPPLVFWKQKLRNIFYARIGSDYASAGALQDTFLRVVREDLSAHARDITLPALLIWGDGDTQTPLADGKRLSELISCARLVVVPGADHLVHQKYPKQVAGFITDFL